MYGLSFIEQKIYYVIILEITKYWALKQLQMNKFYLKILTVIYKCKAIRIHTGLHMPFALEVKSASPSIQI